MLHPNSEDDFWSDELELIERAENIVESKAVLVDNLLTGYEATTEPCRKGIAIGVGFIAAGLAGMAINYGEADVANVVLTEVSYASTVFGSAVAFGHALNWRRARALYIEKMW